MFFYKYMSLRKSSLPSHTLVLLQGFNWHILYIIHNWLSSMLCWNNRGLFPTLPIQYRNVLTYNIHHFYQSNLQHTFIHFFKWIIRKYSVSILRIYFRLKAGPTVARKRSNYGPNLKWAVFLFTSHVFVCHGLVYVTLRHGRILVGIPSCHFRITKGFILIYI